MPPPQHTKSTISHRIIVPLGHISERRLLLLLIPILILMLGSGDETARRRRILLDRSVGESGVMLTLLLLLISPPIPVIPHIPGAKDTVQQPSRDPIRIRAIVLCSVVGITTEVEEGLRRGTCVAPNLENAPLLRLGADVVPKERRTSRRIVADRVDQARLVLIHLVVDEYCFVLLLFGPCKKYFVFEEKGCI